MATIICRRQLRLQILLTDNQQLLWKSRETGGICRRADRRAFDGGVSMFQMPSLSWRNREVERDVPSIRICMIAKACPGICSNQVQACGN